MYINYDLALRAASSAPPATRLGLDFVSDVGEWMGPFALYFSWGFLDAFIQCYT